MMVMAPPWKPRFRVYGHQNGFRSLVRLRLEIDVAKRAADNVKRVHQELGGKSPNVILEDADLAKAVTENIYRLM